MKIISQLRFRTAINVLGDSIGAGIVAHLSRNDLAMIEQEEEDKNGKVNVGMEESERLWCDPPLLNDIDNTSIEIFTRDYFKESVFYSTNVEFEIMGPYYSLIAPVNCHKSG